MSETEWWEKDAQRLNELTKSVPSPIHVPDADLNYVDKSIEKLLNNQHPNPLVNRIIENIKRNEG